MSTEQELKCGHPAINEKLTILNQPFAHLQNICYGIQKQQSADCQNVHTILHHLGRKTVLKASTSSRVNWQKN